MKETRTINLNGLVFHIDNDAYQSLSNYLQDIELRLPADERTDVMTDIEARVCELLQSALFAKNVQVVDLAMIEDIQARIGSPSDFGENKRPKVVHRPQAERSGCGRALKIALLVLLVLFAAQVLLPLLAAVFAISMAGLGLGVGAFSILPIFGGVFFGGHWGMAVLTIVSALLATCLPVYAVIHTFVSLARTRKAPEGRFWLIITLIWLLSIGCFGTAVYKSAVTNDWKSSIPQTIQYIDNHMDDADEETYDAAEDIVDQD